MLIDTPPVDLSTLGSQPPATLTADLAWCLRRFLEGRADEPAMRRAEQALADWEVWSRRQLTLDA
jgi:hypothetical protein